MKTKTISLQGKEYAQVKDRLQEFRKENPNGLIETKPEFLDETIVFKARIVKDKSKIESAEATGHSMGKNNGSKAFEKLETIAVGRALALLGYGSDGEIASSDEMEEFLAHKKEKIVGAVEEAKKKLTVAKNLEQLKVTWSALPIEVKEELSDLKEELKKKFETKPVKTESLKPKKEPKPEVKVEPKAEPEKDIVDLFNENPKV